MKTGFDLVEELFGEDTIYNLREIEEIDKVEEYTEKLSYNEGWYNYYEVTFKYNGKKYSFEYKTHISDNVCETEIFDDTFKEAGDTVVITAAEHERLIKDSELLSCLQACGVDNWNGWSDALQMLNQEE